MKHKIFNVQNVIRFSNILNILPNIMKEIMIKNQNFVMFVAKDLVLKVEWLYFWNMIVGQWRRTLKYYNVGQVSIEEFYQRQCNKIHYHCDSSYKITRCLIPMIYIYKVKLPLMKINLTLLLFSTSSSSFLSTFLSTTLQSVNLSPFTKDFRV